MVWLKVLTVLSCGALNSLGGYSWHNARRYLMPLLLAIETSYIAWSKKAKDWWIGLLILPVIGTLCLGYRNFGSGNFARACWLFTQAVVIGLGLTITGHLFWGIYLGYAIGAGVLGGIYRNWWQPLGDFIAGCYISSIIFLVR